MLLVTAAGAQARSLAPSELGGEDCLCPDEPGHVLGDYLHLDVLRPLRDAAHLVEIANGGGGPVRRYERPCVTIRQRHVARHLNELRLDLGPASAEGDPAATVGILGAMVVRSPPSAEAERWRK